MPNVADAKDLSGSLGVPVKHIAVGGMNSGGTIYISIPQMTPEQATKFIDKVLVPLRNSFGMDRNQMGFAEGSGKPIFFGLAQIERNEILIEPLSDRARYAFMDNAETVKSRISEFLKEHNLSGCFVSDVEHHGRGTTEAQKTRGT